MSLTIGDVSERSGLSRDALRYYEREGLLPPPARDAGGRRTYDPAVLDQLVLVTALREAGFGMRDIATFLGAARQGSTVGGRLDAASDAIETLDAALVERTATLRRARRVLRRWRGEVQRGRETLDPDRVLDCDG